MSVKQRLGRDPRLSSRIGGSVSWQRRDGTAGSGGVIKMRLGSAKVEDIFRPVEGLLGI